MNVPRQTLSFKSCTSFQSNKRTEQGQEEDCSWEPHHDVEDDIKLNTIILYSNVNPEDQS